MMARVIFSRRTVIKKQTWVSTQINIYLYSFILFKTSIMQIYSLQKYKGGKDIVQLTIRYYTFLFSCPRLNFHYLCNPLDHTCSFPTNSKHLNAYKIQHFYLSSVTNWLLIEIKNEIQQVTLGGSSHSYQTNIKTTITIASGIL